MKKRLLSLVLAVLLLTMAVVPAAAQTQQRAADALHALGLFLGMGNGDFALEEKLTRAQGITLVVRVLGSEKVAQKGSFHTPFTDVPDWALGYVGYAYTKGITNGMDAKTFGSNVPLNDYTFLTLVLRALRHSDSGAAPEFVWNDPYALSYRLGLILTTEPDTHFTRGDAVEILWRALRAEVVGTGHTLAEDLIEDDVFTEEDYEEAEDIYEGKEPSGGTVVPPTYPDDPDVPDPPIQPEDPGDPDDPEPPTPPTPPITPGKPIVGVGGLPVLP